MQGVTIAGSPRLRFHEELRCGGDEAAGTPGRWGASQRNRPEDGSVRERRALSIALAWETATSPAAPDRVEQKQGCGPPDLLKVRAARALRAIGRRQPAPWTCGASVRCRRPWTPCWLRSAGPPWPPPPASRPVSPLLASSPAFACTSSFPTSCMYLGAHCDRCCAPTYWLVAAVLSLLCLPSPSRVLCPVFEVVISCMCASLRCGWKEVVILIFVWLSAFAHHRCRRLKPAACRQGLASISADSRSRTAP